MLQVKPGVKLAGVAPELVMGLLVADGVFSRYNKVCMITSVMDGKHSRGSLHYVGLGADLRSGHLPQEAKASIVQQLREALAAEFDVVEEIDHIHLEFQPKGG